MLNTDPQPLNGLAGAEVVLSHQAPSLFLILLYREGSFKVLQHHLTSIIFRVPCKSGYHRERALGLHNQHQDTIQPSLSLSVASIPGSNDPNGIKLTAGPD